MISIGTLDKRISIKRLEDVENDSGYLEQQMSVFLKCWARIEPLRGREYYEAKQISTADNIKVTMRFRKGLDNAMVVEYDGQEYEIINIVDPYMKHATLELMCVKKTHGAGVDVYAGV